MVQPAIRGSPPHLLSADKLLLNKRLRLTISRALTGLTLRERLLAAALATNNIPPGALGYFEEATATTLPTTTIIAMTAALDIAAELVL